MPKYIKIFKYCLLRYYCLDSEPLPFLFLLSGDFFKPSVFLDHVETILGYVFLFSPLLSHLHPFWEGSPFPQLWLSFSGQHQQSRSQNFCTDSTITCPIRFMFFIFFFVDKIIRKRKLTMEIPRSVLKYRDSPLRTADLTLDFFDSSPWSFAIFSEVFWLLNYVIIKGVSRKIRFLSLIRKAMFHNEVSLIKLYIGGCLMATSWQVLGVGGAVYRPR